MQRVTAPRPRRRSSLRRHALTIEALLCAAGAGYAGAHVEECMRRYRETDLVGWLETAADWAEKAGSLGRRAQAALEEVVL
jgi:hypothetical protein